MHTSKKVNTVVIIPVQQDKLTEREEKEGEMLKCKRDVHGMKGDDTIKERT